MTWRGKALYGLAVAAPFGLIATSLAAQTLGQAHEPEISLLRVIGALLFCCLLGAAGALALKYRLRGRPSPGRGLDGKMLSQLVAGLSFRATATDAPDARLRVVETVRLGYQVEVSLLECDGGTVVIVTSPQGAFVVNRDPVKTEDRP